MLYALSTTHTYLLLDWVRFSSSSLVCFRENRYDATARVWRPTKKEGGLTASDTIVWRSLNIHGQPTCGMCNGWTWLHFRWNWFHCLSVTRFSDKFGPLMFSHCKYRLMHLRILHFPVVGLCQCKRGFRNCTFCILKSCTYREPLWGWSIPLIPLKIIQTGCTVINHGPECTLQI